MKKYFLGLTALVLAIGFSAFTKPAAHLFANKTFRLVSTTLPADLTSAVYVENKANWEEAPACSVTSDDIPCSITVPEEYTHIDSESGERVLNTSGTMITIVSQNGFLDTTPNPDVQYKKVAADPSSVYTRINKVF